MTRQDILTADEARVFRRVARRLLDGGGDRCEKHFGGGKSWEAAFADATRREREGKG